MPGTLVLRCAVDLDAAALVERDAGLGKAEPVGEGRRPVAISTTSASIVSAAPPLTGSKVTRRALLGLGDAGDLGAELEVEALLGEHALELLGDLAVHAAEDRVEIFDHGDLGAEPRPDRAELEPDDAAADHDQGRRHLVQLQRAGRRHDHLLVDLDLDAGNAGDIRAGGDDDVLRLDLLDLAVLAGHRRPCRRRPPCRCRGRNRSCSS